MNRVIGDYFENLLYQIFVAIDEQSTVAEVYFRRLKLLKLLKFLKQMFSRKIFLILYSNRNP